MSGLVDMGHRFKSHYADAYLEFEVVGMGEITVHPDFQSGAEGTSTIVYLAVAEDSYGYGTVVKAFTQDEIRRMARYGH